MAISLRRRHDRGGQEGRCVVSRYGKRIVKDVPLPSDICKINDVIHTWLNGETEADIEGILHAPEPGNNIPKEWFEITDIMVRDNESISDAAWKELNLARFNLLEESVLEKIYFDESAAAGEDV